MKLELIADGPGPDGEATIRLLVLNDSGKTAALDRRLLLGPHPGAGNPMLLASEPSFKDETRNIVHLNPWCLYGRERRYTYDAGEVTFHAYLLRRPTDQLLPTGPADKKALLIKSELVVQFS